MPRGSALLIPGQNHSFCKPDITVTITKGNASADMGDHNPCKRVIEPQLSIKAEHTYGDQDHRDHNGHNHKNLCSVPNPWCRTIQAIGTKGT